MEEEEKKTSLWWMFVPIFLGAVGGAVAWKIHKEKEREFARIMLVVGIVFTLIIIPFYIWLLLQYL